jgi:hypothetical protein
MSPSQKKIRCTIGAKGLVGLGFQENKALRYNLPRRCVVVVLLVCVCVCVCVCGCVGVCVCVCVCGCVCVCVCV